VECTAGSAPRIVAGVSGSPASHWALAWALGTARRYGLPLTVVSTYPPPVVGAQYGMVAVAVGEESARAVVDQAFRAVCDGRPADVPIKVKYVMGHPGRALTSTAGAGDLLVIGSSGRLRGATRRFCARHTRGPLVIVPCADASELLGTPVRTARRIERKRATRGGP
jgi:nucleotide-binding universal stress UspA family protein